jgi:cytochrome c2
MKKSFTVVITILLAGCATVSTLRPRNTDLANMQQKAPGISLEEAEKGFKLYKYNCAGCHNLHKPETYSISEWEKVLPEMLGRAKISSEKDAKLIRDYLFAKSK